VADPDAQRRDSRANWNMQAAGWHKRRDELRRTTLPVSAWLVDAIDPQPGQTLLELAAGTGDTGFLAAELIQPGGTLISSDFAPEMLTKAQLRAEELGIGNVRFKQIDAESIDLEAASLDGVLCRWGFMLMVDAEAALRETRRVLRPDARVALAAWAGPEHNQWAAMVGRVLAEHGLVEPPVAGGPGPFAWAEPGVIAEHLENAGFTEHQVEPLDFAIEYPSFDDWWAAQRDLSRMLSSALEAAGPEAEAKVREVSEERAQAFARDDGTYVVPARTWVAWAGA
jgi:SAM-dependent methyltransferase